MKTFNFLIAFITLFSVDSVAGDFATNRVQRFSFANLDKSSSNYFLKIAQPQLEREQNMSKKNSFAIAKASLLTISFPGLGSADSLLREYAAPRSKIVGVWVYYDSDDGTQVDIGPGYTHGVSFPSYEAAIELLQNQLRLISSAAFTNTAFNKDHVLHVFSYTATYSDSLGWVRYMYVVKTFSLIKSPDGTYSLPDFSDFTFQLADTVVYELPGVVRARATATYNPETTTSRGELLLGDSAITSDGSQGADFSLEPGHEYIELSTGYASSGTTGPTLLKLTVYMADSENDIRYFGPVGNPFPAMLPPKLSDGSISFEVGGFPGQSFTVDSQSCVGGPWSQCITMIVPTYSLYGHFEEPVGDANRIYRVRITDQ